MAKKGTELKLTITRTYSESRKVNIGNYESRDFFSSAGFSIEVSADIEEKVVHEIGNKLQQDAEREVKLILKKEVEVAIGQREGKKPEDGQVSSSNDKFSETHRRNYPGKKFIPREVTPEEEEELGAAELDQEFVG